jgi:hypothetical protein
MNNNSFNHRYLSGFDINTGKKLWVFGPFLNCETFLGKNKNKSHFFSIEPPPSYIYLKIFILSIPPFIIFNESFRPINSYLYFKQINSKIFSIALETAGALIPKSLDILTLDIGVLNTND